MNNNVFNKLLEYINNERESFEMLLSADNTLGLNVSYDDISNYLEFASNGVLLPSSIVNNVIITEGDILSVLKVIHDLVNYEGEFILYINSDNIGTISYLVSRANKIYSDLMVKTHIKIDYSDNYNTYLNTPVTIIGSEDFVNTSSVDFNNVSIILV